MKPSITAAAIALLLSPTVPSLAQDSPTTSRAGEAYLITQSYKTSEEASDGSSGNSKGTVRLIESVIARRDGGIELEYDLPDDATSQDRASNWQFPARVFKPSNGPIKLLNTRELERRLDHWLKAAKWDRTVCGQWIFTWNAFHIECDPESVIELLAKYDLTSQDLHPGAQYLDAWAVEAQPISRIEGESAGATFKVVAKVDPDKVRLERAESDVAVGAITQKPISLEAALRERGKERVSGSLSVTWATDDAGVPTKRTKTIALEIQRPDGTLERQTRTELVERRRVEAATPHSGS